LVFPRPGADYVAPGKKRKQPLLVKPREREREIERERERELLRKII
jgi:hypothetical protein